MHAFSFPADMREHTVMRRQVFTASLRMMLPVLLLMALFLAALFLAVEIWRYGFKVFSYPGYLWKSWLHFLSSMSWVVLVWAAFIALLVRRRVQRQKTLGLPVLYGFDEAGVYFNCAAFESAIRWEYFNTWREKGEYILLHDGIRWVIWPKAPWSEAELETVRGLLRQKANAAPLAA